MTRHASRTGGRLALGGLALVAVGVATTVLGLAWPPDGGRR
jgi:hypothetical protein